MVAAQAWLVAGVAVLVAVQALPVAAVSAVLVAVQALPVAVVSAVLVAVQVLPAAAVSAALVVVQALAAAAVSAATVQLVVSDGWSLAAPDFRVAWAVSEQELAAWICPASWADWVALLVLLQHSEDDLAELDLVYPLLEAWWMVVGWV